jgi:hypothetical protein
MRENRYIDIFAAMQMVNKYYKTLEKNLRDREYPIPVVID